MDIKNFLPSFDFKQNEINCYKRLEPKQKGVILAICTLATLFTLGWGTTRTFSYLLGRFKPIDEQYREKSATELSEIKKISARTGLTPLPPAIPPAVKHESIEAPLPPAIPPAVKHESIEAPLPPAIPPAVKQAPEYTPITIQEAMASYIKEHIPVEFQKKILDQHKIIMSQNNNRYLDLQLLGNITGDGRLSKIKCEGYTVEGLYSYLAVYRFAIGYDAFIEHLKLKGELTRDTKKKLLSIQQEYLQHYLTSLLKKVIKDLHWSKKSDEVKKPWLDLWSERMHAELTRIQNGEIQRSSSIAGYDNHYVYFRFEAIPDSENIRLCFFNLGAGSSELQNHDSTTGHRKCEVRVGDIYYKHPVKGRQIEASPKWLEENFQAFTQNLAKTSATGSYSDYLALIEKYSPKKNRIHWGKKVTHVPTTILSAEPQKMGDCTCKGQWEAGRKLFSRLEMEDLWVEFADFFADYNLSHLVESAELPKSKPLQALHRPKKENISIAQLFQICWESFYNMKDNRGKLKPCLEHSRNTCAPEDRWKYQTLQLPSIGDNGEHVEITLERLFDGKESVILGRDPSNRDDTAAMYCITEKENESIPLNLIKLFTKGGQVYLQCMGDSPNAVIYLKDKFDPQPLIVGESFPLEKVSILQIDQNKPDFFLFNPAENAESSKKVALHKASRKNPELTAQMYEQLLPPGTFVILENLAGLPTFIKKNRGSKKGTSSSAPLAHIFNEIKNLRPFTKADEQKLISEIKQLLSKKLQQCIPAWVRNLDKAGSAYLTYPGDFFIYQLPNNKFFLCYLDDDNQIKYREIPTDIKGILREELNLGLSHFLWKKINVQALVEQIDYSHKAVLHRLFREQIGKRTEADYLKSRPFLKDGEYVYIDHGQDEYSIIIKKGPKIYSKQFHPAFPQINDEVFELLKGTKPLSITQQQLREKHPV